jgi:pimeloyl-ACP methyl ester carboxylesterase
MAVRVDPQRNRDVTLQGVTIRTRNLRGTVDVITPQAGRTRSPGEATRIDLTLADHGLVTQQTVIINGQLTPRAAAGADAPVRGTADRPEEFDIEVAPPAAGFGQVVLQQDALTGALRWSLPEPASEPAGDATRGGPRTVRYRLKVDAAPEDVADGADRGIGSWIVKKVVKILTYKLAAKVIKSVANYFARKWERKNRPYGLYQLGDNNIMSGERLSPDWANLSGRKTLMLVHGTFSTCAGGFGGLSDATVGELRHRYDNRILAFDHYTITEDPVDNIRWLLKEAGSNSLNLDLLCHSRGGLVSRVLAEGYPDSNLDLGRVNVDRLVFTAAPNAGTVLTDTDKLGSYIDLFTNLFTLASNPILDGLAGLIELVKDVAANSVDGLTGLQSMRPNGKFLTDLNNQQTGPGNGYLSIAADFEPAGGGSPILWTLDQIADGAFTMATNDLVVPTDGVYAGNGSSRFPIPVDRRLDLDKSRAIIHTDYFRHGDVQQQILSWLPG